MATAESAAQGTDPGRLIGATSLVVVGGGEHARVVVEAARSRPDRWRVLAFADPDPASRLARLEPGLENIGDDEALRAWFARRRHDPAHLILGVGGGTRPGGRSAVVAGFGGAEWATVVHAAATVSPSSVLAPGAFIGAAAVVQAGASISRHAIVNSGAILEHDVRLGEFSHVGPGAAVGGGTEIGVGVFVGLGARIRDHVAIGDGARIGMGAVVVGDVAAGEVVVGVPARRSAAR